MNLTAEKATNTQNAWPQKPEDGWHMCPLMIVEKKSEKTQGWESRRRKWIKEKHREKEQRRASQWDASVLEKRWKDESAGTSQDVGLGRFSKAGSRFCPTENTLCWPQPSPTMSLLLSAGPSLHWCMAPTEEEDTWMVRWNSSEELTRNSGRARWRFLSKC